MLTLEQIKTRIQKIDSKLGPELARMAEIQILPQVLLQGETLEAITRGSYQKSNGLIIATNHRILYIDSTSCTPYPYANLSSIRYRSSIEFKDGNFHGTLHLQISGKPLTFAQVPGNGTDFAKQVNMILENYSPDPAFYTEKEVLDAPAKKKGKALLFVASALLLCLVIVYFATSIEPSSPPSALAVNADDFPKQWNEAAKDLGSPYLIEDLKVVENENKRSFTHYFQDDLKIMGILSKDGQLTKLMLIGHAEQSLPLLTEQVISSIEPAMSPPARGELLTKLGINDQDQQASLSGIRYSITYSDEIGVIFEASALP